MRKDNQTGQHNQLNTKVRQGMEGLENKKDKQKTNGKMASVPPNQ